MDKNENYTPPWLITKIKIVLGGDIDLDPMSCDYANDNFVKAKKYFTKERSCFDNNWGYASTVFMNPPYSDGLYVPSINRFLDEHAIIDFEAIVLTNNNTDTKATRMLMDESSAICFPPRISYYDKEGNIRKGNRYAQMITYFGQNKKEFKRVFEPSVGVVLYRY